ncbi:MAG: hypothetical protein EXS59_02140 [Candidatus Taylorbacteria bacterium]|nr:hypothetical protein [Candidatus Taylorbacteria bacterium]
MYERFTDRARKVMQLANAEAHRLNHHYVGTEHVLIGLIKAGSSPGIDVFYNLNIDPDKILSDLGKIIASGTDPVTDEKLPHTPRLKRVIEFAIEESRGFNHSHVGTEHLLLGILREQEGVAAQVLMNLGVTLEGAREQFLILLGIPQQLVVPIIPGALKVVRVTDDMFYIEGGEQSLDLKKLYEMLVELCKVSDLESVIVKCKNKKSSDQLPYGTQTH